ncbi:MAG: hypothetical protein M1275_00325 [Patescibacteria group bacterium]|nr:hypothetical protein [Patescibacteria group bacterium]
METAHEWDLPLFFLSGEFGFIPAATPIPDYDHQLQFEEVKSLVARVSWQIREQKISELIFLAQPRNTPG